MKLLNKDYKRFPYETEGTIVEKDLNYKELTRKSNRQKNYNESRGHNGVCKNQRLK